MLYLSSLAVQFSRTIWQAFLLRSSPSLHTRLRYYTISRSVCQGVFQKFFQLFFKPLDVCRSSGWSYRLIWGGSFSRKLSSHRRCQSLLPFALRDLYIISYLLEFVKRFWKSFLSFFRRPSRSSRFRSWRDFYIISYLKPFVKWFFKKSWNSFFDALANSLLLRSRSQL